MGRTTLSEVEDDLMPSEDDLTGSVADNSELEGGWEGRWKEMEREREWESEERGM